MANEISKKERSLRIEMLEAENRASKSKAEDSKRHHEKELQKIHDISNAIAVGMSIFNPFILISFKDNGEAKNDK